MSIAAIHPDLSPRSGLGTPAPVAVEVTVPVFNEEDALEPSIRRLRAYLDETFPFDTTVVIADNASTDGTWSIACRLAETVSGVRALHLDAKGRGRALRASWSSSPAAVVAYMDVDLSTDLDALLPLVAPLLSGHSDLAVGSRLAPGAVVIRGPKRELISRAYNRLLKITLASPVHDAQCGFKALRRDVALRLLPQVEDQAWFFDTEMLAVARRLGLRIHEVPVDWVDDPDSRVDLLSTAWADVRGVARVLCRFALEPAPGPDRPPDPRRFTRVGLVSTVCFLALFLALRGRLGAYGADVLSLALCTGANLLAHARFSFGRPPAGRRRAALGAALLFASSATSTALALVLAGLLGVTSPLGQVLALAAGTVLGAAGRFVMLTTWVFRSTVTSPRRARGAPAPEGMRSR